MDRWGFPFEPYPIQTNLMEAVHRCIEEGGIGIFESPTGTGKSLALICGACSWLENTQSIAEEQSEPEWILAHRKRAKRLDGDAQISRLSSMVDNHCSKTKIYFCSRTHTQLSQSMREFQKTRFGRFGGVALGSRQMLCINDQIRNALAPNEECLGLQSAKSETHCPFLWNKGQEDWDTFCSKVGSVPMDIEDLVRLGRQLQICPYYGTQKALSDAQFVTLPYQLLLQPQSREPLDLEGNIVIFDEAHNLVRSIQSMYSPEVDLDVLNVLGTALQEYIGIYQKLLSGSNLWTLNVLNKTVQNLILFLTQSLSQRSTERVYEINDFVIRTGLDTINVFQLEQSIGKGQVSQKLAGFMRPYNPNNLSLVNRVMNMLSMLGNSGREGKIIVMNQRGRVVCKYLLLDCRSHFKEIVDKSRAIILAGGTMEPCEDMVFQLFPVRLDREIMRLSCGHIVPRTNFLAMVLDRGPSDRQFRFTLDKTDDSMLRELGLTLLNFVRIVPFGIVVFFPSYSLMESALEEWNRSTLTQDLANRKQLFREDRDGTATGMLLSQFRDANKIPTDRVSGGLLFAVAGGRLAEGINFENNNGRAVFMVGIPYPNIRSREIIERRMYHSKHGRSGSGYLDNLAMTSVNQSVGRVLRHQNDYAAIYLVDSRYLQNNIQNKLSKWIRDKLDTHLDFGRALALTLRFFRQKKIDAIE